MATSLIAPRIKGAYQTATYFVDAGINLFQGSRAAVSSVNSYRQGDIAGGTFNAVGAALGLGAGAARFKHVQEVMYAQRMARANSQLNILDNGICFVAGTPVMTGEQLHLAQDEFFDSSMFEDGMLDDLLLPTAAVTIGTVGYFSLKEERAKDSVKKN